MTVHTSHQKSLVNLIAEAVGYARLSHELVFHTVIPLLPPQRRGIAEDVQWQLNSDYFINAAFLRDLTSLMNFLEREIAKGTQLNWVADEHNVHGGHHVRHLDDRAFALSNAAVHLIDLRHSIEDVLDFATAGRLAEALTQD
jgi:hypothetical protein